MVSYATFGAPAPFDPAARWVTSPLLPAAALGALRLAAGLYALATLCVVLAVDVSRNEGQSYLSYFTRLSYIGLCAYLIASGVQTLAFAARRGRAKVGYPLQRWPRFLQALHVLLFATVATFPFVVTAVFWALLSSPTTFSTVYNSWENVSMHAMNSGFALCEIFFTNAPPAPWACGPLVLLLIGLYLGVAYITHATQGFYTYSFLDPKKEGAKLAAYIAGIAVGTLVVFALTRMLCAARERLARGRGLAALGATPSRESLGEWQEVSLRDEEKGASTLDVARGAAAPRRSA